MVSTESLGTDRPVAKRPACFFRNCNRLVGIGHAAITVLTPGFVGSNSVGYRDVDTALERASVFR
jgi:hypothetical protein